MKPILFQLGSFQVHTFGILVGLGFLFGLWSAARRLRAAGLDGNLAYELAFPWILVGSLVGARLLYVVSYWDRDFAGRPWIEPFQIWRGGLVFYGGLMGAILVGVWRVRALKLPIWKVADALAPGIALGHVFGRLGCLLNGCCFGRACDLPWGIHFAADHDTHGIAVHPTQIYEALLNLGLFGALTWLHGRRRFDGHVFGAYLVAYAFIRAFTEYFRGDYGVTSAPTSFVFTPGQWTSGVILACGVALLLLLRRAAPAANPPATPAGPPA